MDKRTIILLIALCALSVPCYSQIDLKTGSVYGRVADEEDHPLAGVNILLQSDVRTEEKAVTGESGSFRFAQLPPGTYSVTFSLQGFASIRQENVQVSVGSQVQLRPVLRPSLTEEVTVVAGAPLLDFLKTGTFQVFDREYLDQVPTARDPWTVIDQTTGIATNRYEVSQQGIQSLFSARGGSGAGWNYDAVNVTDPVAPGASAGYYDFDSLEEIQITTSAGTFVNMVTKRGGNKLSGNASYYFSDEGLQAHNTPEELVAEGLNDQSNRLDRITEYGFDVGGPIVKDKLFAWGAYRKNQIDVFTISNQPDSTELENWNVKCNFDWSPHQESQFSYFLPTKTKMGRAFNAAIQAPETLWDQETSDSILQGIWGFQHTWLPSDRMMVTARYSYVGLGFQLVPRGGRDVPMIYLAAIPRYENTGFYNAPIDRPAHDINVDGNYFKGSWLGGDHEFKFGFDYRTTSVHSFSSFGNGQLVIDYYQTTPGGPLTSGYLYAQHDRDVHVKMDTTSVYASDTYRRDRLTLSLGFTFTHSTGTNQPSSIRSVPGFEAYVGPIEYPGGDPGLAFNTVSPLVGATFDVTGDGKNLIRGNFSRYYDIFNMSYLTFSNPAFTYNGAVFAYTNLNNDRTITPDEVTAGPFYYGGLNGPTFNLDEFNARKLYDDNLKPGWSNAFSLGYERELTASLSAAITYNRVETGGLIQNLPYGVTTADYIPGGVFTQTTPLGAFTVPYFVLGKAQDGTAILKNLHDYRQSYSGVDIVLRKRMSQNLMLNGSLVIQRQKAQYHGGDSAGFTFPGNIALSQFFPFDPGLLPFADGKAFANYQIYSQWELKIDGVYQLPWEMSVGASVKYRQGFPYLIAGTVQDSSLYAFTGTERHLVLVEPYGNRRFDNIFNLDLQVEKAVDLGNYGRLSLIATLFNVTNENTVFRRNGSIVTQTFNSIQEHVAPRSLRLGLRYSF